MARYNVGDIVTFRNDLRVGESYGGWMWRTYNHFLRGMDVRITAADPSDDTYQVDDGGTHWFSEEMFRGPAYLQSQILSAFEDPSERSGRRPQHRRTDTLGETTNPEEQRISSLETEVKQLKEDLKAIQELIKAYGIEKFTEKKVGTGRKVVQIDPN